MSKVQPVISNEIEQQNAPPSSSSAEEDVVAQTAALSLAPANMIDPSDPRRDVVSEDEDEDDEVLVGESNSFEMLPGGELLLKRADGTRKIIGVRWLKQYYKQNARVIDQRASVIAAQREKLLLMYKRIGVDTSSELIKDLIAAGAENNQQQSRALSVALNRAAPRFAGVELAAARQHFKREHKQRTKLGMQENWNIKHRVAKQRSRAEGVGVHG